MAWMIDSANVGTAMRRSATAILVGASFVVPFACTPAGRDQGMLSNAIIREHEFLVSMSEDPYYPPHLVEQCRSILVQMCFAIECEGITEERHLYPITHHFTDELNALQDDFAREDIEMETGAREALAEEFMFIASAYGFDADVEEMIAPREW